MSSRSEEPYVYVASSGRNEAHGTVVDGIRALGIACFDFKRRSGAFSWDQVGVDADGEFFEAYMNGLTTPRARKGFEADFAAMQRATHFVLVLPCGRSAHLEAGWAMGQGTPTAILFDEPHLVTPELMYLMADLITCHLHEVLEWLGRIR